MKKLVFDKQEVVPIDELGPNDVIIGYKDGVPVATIFNDCSRWSFYGYLREYFSGIEWDSADKVISLLVEERRITEFYVV